jgi:hypothetical protein
MAMTSGCQIGILRIATVNPAIAAKTTGMRHRVKSRVSGLSKRAPNEKCRVFSTMKRMTAAGRADFFEQLFHDRMQPAGADVFGRSLTDQAISASRLTPVRRKIQVTPSVVKQRLVLLGQTGIGLGQNALEVGHRQRIEFDTNRKAALQLGNQVRRLGQVKAPLAMNRM